MKKTLEKLWDEYFAEECATIEGEKEKSLAKKALEMHKAADEILTQEQRDAVEKYLDTLCEIQDSFVKKAFFKGCEFATAFFLEMG